MMEEALQQQQQQQQQQEALQQWIGATMIKAGTNSCITVLQNAQLTFAHGHLLMGICHFWTLHFAH